MDQIDNSVLLRAISEQLTGHIIPDLSSGDAIERAKFAVLALQRIAGRLDLQSSHSAAMADEYSTMLEMIIEGAAAAGFDTDVEQTRRELRQALQQADVVRKAAALRALGVRLVNVLSTPERGWFHDSDARNGGGRLIADLLRAEMQWCGRYEQALSVRTGSNDAMLAGGSPSRSVQELVTPESTTAYLREKLPDAARVQVHSVRILPGGRSKYTIFLSLTGSDALPAEIVMRQDTGATMIPTAVVDEFPLLSSLASYELFTAKPLYVEREINPLGRPFILVSKLAGKAPGDYFAFPGGSRALVEQLACFLGRMHTIDVGKIEVPQQRGRTHVQYTLDQIKYFRTQWHDNALEPSPIIEYAFAWLDAECRKGIGGPALVHGDIAPHNYLVDDGRLTGIVDWEFAHVGDPAEDLAYRREFFEQYMPWKEFLSIYYGEGAAPVDERRLRMFTVWGFIRNASFGALGHREFKDGSCLDFANAALSTFLYSYFDQVVGGALVSRR
jgi:aminoglycoside phosphotransferase (APT) family kinase protein